MTPKCLQNSLSTVCVEGCELFVKDAKFVEFRVFDYTNVFLKSSHWKLRSSALSNIILLHYIIFWLVFVILMGGSRLLT